MNFDTSSLHDASTMLMIMATRDFSTTSDADLKRGVESLRAAAKYAESYLPQPVAEDGLDEEILRSAEAIVCQPFEALVDWTPKPRLVTGSIISRKAYDALNLCLVNSGLRTVDKLLRFVYQQHSIGVFNDLEKQVAEKLLTAPSSIFDREGYVALLWVVKSVTHEFGLARNDNRAKRLISDINWLIKTAFPTPAKASGERE